MRQVCQITKHYPIESILKIDDRRFATCCGLEHFLDTYEINDGWAKREVFNTRMPLVYVNSVKEGNYLCQNMDTLLSFGSNSEARLQIEQGWFISQTKQTSNNRYVNLTTEGKLNVYRLAANLQIVDQLQLKAGSRRKMVPIVSQSGNIRLQKQNGSLIEIDLTEKSCTGFVNVHAEIKDLANINPNLTAALTGSEIVFVDWRISRCIGKFVGSQASTMLNCPSSHQIATNFDNNTIKIYDLKMNNQRTIQVPNNYERNQIKTFEFLKDYLILIANNVPKIEVYELN